MREADTGERVFSGSLHFCRSWSFSSHPAAGEGGGPPPPPPLVVNTDNATSITQNGALLNGTANGNGIASEAWFAYGTNPNLVSPDNTTIQAIAAGTVNQPVNIPQSGLTLGTTYFFRLMASNIHWRAEGEIFSFTTRNPPPSVTTDNATFITLNGATLNGTVNPNGVVTNTWFEYGDNPNLVVFTLTDNQSLAAGRVPVTIGLTLSGLNSGKTYYYRAVAASVEGEEKGQIKSFSTDFPPPATTTGNATNITTIGATFNGTVNPNGFTTESWFEYGADPLLASYNETSPQAMGSGTTDQPVSATPIAPLNPWSTYYFRMVAQSVADPTIITKGAIRSFPTGEYYVAVGDSITAGSHDTIIGDGTGYEPILENLLAALKVYPIAVANAGLSGTTSANGASLIGSNLSLYPSAKYFLVMYGTNDAFIPAVSKATFILNMQAIITAIKTAGKIPYLAKVPYTSDPMRSDAAIRDYNAAIDELRISNGISVVAPDFYTWFQSHQSELDDGIHPNDTGYQSMANLWFDVLP